MSNHVAWIDAYIEELKRAGVKGMTLEAAKYETISKLAFDPWKQPVAAPESATASAAGGEPNKRPRFADGSAPNQAPPGQMIGDAAVQKVKDMVATGRWLEVTADSKRANTGQYIEKYGPHSVKIMDFIIDGSERSTYDWKTTIKEAGYVHYSGSDRSGWKPFSLPDGKRGQGKEVKDTARLERYWEVQEFNTAKMNEAGDAIVFRGEAYSMASGATEWGPRGPQGPKWGSNRAGD